MRKTVLLGLMLLLTGSSLGSAQRLTTVMTNTELELFLHDLDRDSARWKGVVDEVDVDSLKDLPFRKCQLMEKARTSLGKNLAQLSSNIASVREFPSLAHQLELVMALVETEEGMDELSSNLDIESSADMEKFSAWSNDTVKAYGEISAATTAFYGQVHVLSVRIDGQIDVTKIR